MYYSYTFSGSQWVSEYSYFEPARTKMFDGTEWTEVEIVTDRFLDDKPMLLVRLLLFLF